MKNKLSKFIFLFVFMLLVSSVNTIDVFAGQRTVTSSYMTEGGLNNAQWNFTDNNIVIEGEKLVVPAKSSTKYTKIISKQIATRSDGLKTLTELTTNLRFTNLPQGEQFIFAFGLDSIDGQSGSVGNVELVFTSENGIKMSIIAYSESGAETILEKMSCGISRNSNFKLKADISVSGVLSVSINGKTLCSKALPVSGEGRFGILQTGSCGFTASELVLKVYSYERPENVNIDEDFESGEWNTNILGAHMFNTNGIVNSGMKIEEYNGSKVLMFRNVGQAYFGTKMQYSNFELTFDIPFFQKSNVYEEEKLRVKATSEVCLCFGEEMERPTNGGYLSTTDLLMFQTTYAKSHIQKIWEADYNELQLTGLAGSDSMNTGYSIKLTVIDQHAVIQVKPLTGTKYTTIAEAEYEDYKLGYVRIWAAGSGNFAIDNFKLTNLDENPKLVEVEYKSSVMTVEDYVLTEAEQELVFREEVTVEENKKPEYGLYIVVGCLTGALILILIGVIFNAKGKKDARKEILKDEKK